LADRVHVYIVTNTNIDEGKNAICSVLQEKGFSFDIHTPKLLGHPYLLPLCHVELFQELLSKEQSVSHFLYLEDDLLITDGNIEYWLQARQDLQVYGLIPSFLRYERKDDGELYAVDVWERTCFETAPKIFINNGYCYMNMPYPYQGMYLLDRELMAEYMSYWSSNPYFSRWGLRETGAQGVTYVNVPPGFKTRNLVGFDTDAFAVDPRCLIHHVSNTYVAVADPRNRSAKIPVRNLVFRKKFVKQAMCLNGLIYRLFLLLLLFFRWDTIVQYVNSPRDYIIERLNRFKRAS